MNIVFEKIDSVHVDDLTLDHFVIAYKGVNDDRPLIMCEIHGRYFFAYDCFIAHHDNDNKTYTTHQDLLSHFREKGYNFWTTKERCEFSNQMIRIYSGERLKLS